MVTGFISLTKRGMEEGLPTALTLGHGSFLHWCPARSFERDSAVLPADAGTVQLRTSVSRFIVIVTVQR